MSKYKEIQAKLKSNPKIWLITGVAGFIGSNLLEHLLKLDQKVVGLDNFSTGFQSNLDEVKELVTKAQWKKFNFIQGDIQDYTSCISAVKDIDFVLHQAALGSVPRSIKDPLSTNSSNILGFLNILHAAMEEGVQSFTYAASSSTYGDHEVLPKLEENIGNPLSPYAVTKYVNELYAGVYARCFGFKTIGLRYFNVFGKHQDPNGAYAAVIPRWISAMIQGKDVFINGDGQTSRDFCYIQNTIQMNILAATAKDDSKDQIYNVAVGDRTSLNDLYNCIKNSLEASNLKITKNPIYKDFREGDVRHSQADISKAKKMLHYDPHFNISEGINHAVSWYVSKYEKENS